MKLDRLILVNWGALCSDEYPMGNMTLLTGPTGSGKSTLIDALQTVMTAVHQNIFNYNPGQDETSQGARNGKTKRTLWSYIVGAEDNLFARPDGAHGYVAAVFKPSEGEAVKEFTAIVGASAHIGGSGTRRVAEGERLVLLIVDEAVLTLNDLASSDLEGNMKVVEVEKVEHHLKATYPKVTNFRDTKGEYLCQLYGRFRGQRSVSREEAEAAAKAWSQSIAHKPIGSVDDLVKTQILDFDQGALAQRIANIGDLMRQVHNLRLESERLRASVALLEGIGGAIMSATGAYERAVQYQLVAAKRSLRDDEQAIEAARCARTRLETRITAEKEVKTRAESERDGLHDGLVKIEATLSGIPAAHHKATLEAQLEKAQEELKAALRELVTALTQVEALQETSRALIGMEFPPHFRTVSASARAVAAQLNVCGTLPLAQWKGLLQALLAESSLEETIRVAGLVRELSQLAGRFDTLHAVLAGATDSFAAAVSEQRGALREELTKAGAVEKEAAARKRNLAEGGADYPRHIHVALESFRSELPAARAQVLCDLIEPLDEAWQPAIEGYMGMARFNIVVPAEWESRAIEFVRSRHLRTSVIQGSLCAKHARPERVPTDSIIHEMKTSHPVARDYLIEQFGQVVKVFDVETLRFTGRGLMQDGKASGGRTMFTAGADSLVFGQAQREKAREAAQRAYNEALRELTVVKESARQLDGLLAMVGKLELPSFSAASRATESIDVIDRSWDDLRRLDLTEVEKLEDEKTVLKLKIKAQNGAINAASERLGSLCKDLSEQEKLITQKKSNLTDKTDRVAAELACLRNTCEVNDALSLVELEALADVLVEQMSAEQARQDANVHLMKALQALGDVRGDVATYNQAARTGEHLEFGYSTDHHDDDFAPTYGVLVRMMARVRAQLSAQRDNGLYRNGEELHKAEDSFNDVFTRQFCYEIRNAVDAGVRTLRVLNHELERLKFGTDRFHIDWSTWVPEFKDYYDFFSAAYELSEAQETGSLFAESEAGLSPENCVVRDRLVSLLLSNDQERALRELQRIADYRNYRRYEIWKESDSGSRVALSEWGTGSGGQLETPAYIVRAAVVTNRLKHFEKGSNLKMLVNDESFAKMDERRAHDVMRFIRDSLGMQLVCAMPTKHAGALKSEFTKEWCFTRTEAGGRGEVDFISEADERDLNPDQLRVRWEAWRLEKREQARLLFEAQEPQAAT